MMKNRQLLFDGISTIWENKDGCSEQYICDAELYLISMLSHSYNIIFDCGVTTPGHDRDVVVGFKYTDKRFLYM